MFTESSAECGARHQPKAKNTTASKSRHCSEHFHGYQIVGKSRRF